MRPPEAVDRLIPGPWEGDHIKCAGNKSTAGAPVEHSSRLALLAHMPDARVAPALAAFTAELQSIATPTRKTLCGQDS